MCKRCDERGKPEHLGSNPKCAFETGIYSNNNWQCATIGKLRYLMDKCGHSRRENDESIGVLKIPDAVGNGYLVMNWYKNRGSVGGALILEDDEAPRLLTLETAEAIIEAYHIPSH